MSTSNADIVIVGAGIVGAGLASALSRRGADVVLVDPHIGEGASAGNAGMVVPSYATPMSTPENLRTAVRSFGSRSAAVNFAWPLGARTLGWMGQFALACRTRRVKRDTAVLHRLASESLQLYKQMCDEGLDLGVRECGWLWLTTDRAEKSSLTRTVHGLREAGAVCEQMGADEAREVQAGLGPSVAGGVWFPHESVLDPAKATTALIEDAVEHGARVIREEVVGVHREGTEVRTVRTRSHVLSSDQFVIAAGAASRDVGRLFGVRVPIEPGYGWSVTLDDHAGVLRHALMSVEDHVVISPLPGRVRITGGMQFGGRGGSRPRDSDVRALRVAAETVMPPLGDLPKESAWQGARPMTASGLPIVRRAGATNIVIAAGHGPLGMTLAPSTVRAAARELLGGSIR
ncbi:NAD(P)/FAD-dependent oxidoreductase [Parasphingorhabdus pacifica]